MASSYNTKIDLPQVFQEEGLSLLTVGRGEYLIGHFDVFSKLDSELTEGPIVKSVPSHISSVDFNNITSEAVALNVAHLTGMIDDVLSEDFTNLTMSGRMGSSTLNFSIRNKKTKSLDSIKVENATIEIDGNYEGVNNYGLIEAKNNVPMEFIVRQLYYPYLATKDRVSHKNVVPLFFTYSKGIFSFHEFEFIEPEIYSSIRKVSQRNFTLNVFEEIDINDVMEIYQNTKIIPEPSTPFPQADNFSRVLDLLDFLNTPKGRSKDEITKKYSFVDRQSDYYWNSILYLGFGKKPKRGGNRKLNAYGRKVANEFTLKQQKLAFVRAILERGAFREYFDKTKANGGRHLKEEEIINIILKHSPKIGKSTVPRRAKSVRGWVHWILTLTR